MVKEGREFWIDPQDHDGLQAVFTEKTEGCIHVTEAAPLRARIALLEEELAEAAKLLEQGAQLMTVTGHNGVVKKLQESNATLRAQLEGFKTARIMAGPEDVKEYIHNHEVAHSELQKKGQGDETV
jgi:hypothetical protein